MADEAKNDGREPITPIELKTVLRDLSAKKDKASEAAGLIGKATSTAVERYGLEKNALTQVRRMQGMEETKRQAFLSSTIEYAYKAGFFDQIDAFDPMSAMLKEILDHIEGNKQPTVNPESNIHTLNS